ncbi:MAG: hypothetical protein KY460_14320 [Actinobacteria bacterium]|nr:hypothetical protein [Actinomycetota bacterium]
MQTKARDADPRDPTREAAWLDKQIGRAVRQINGTARRLQDRGVDMDNGRGHRVHVDGPSIDWAGVVIIDHPDPPDDHATPAAGGGNVPYVVLLRRDWEFLFDQLRSTHAVVSYLHRVDGSTEKLGTEPERYYELAAADAAAPPGPLDPALEGVGDTRSVPLLPAAPADIDDDAHSIVRIRCFEDIVTSDIEPGRHTDRLSVLASIDSLPVAYRAELGRLLIEALTASQQTEPDTVFWRFRTYVAGADRDQLGFGVCSVFNETIRSAFGAWLRLRHHERISRTGTTDLTSVGVLLTPRHDGYREWDTTMAAINGDPQLTDQELQQYRELFNNYRSDAA